MDVERRHKLLTGLGNVFLGLSLGLVAYYGITNAFTAWQQRQLRADLGALGAIAGRDPQVVEDENPFDFSGWEEQDRAYWEALEPGEVFGRLVIEKIELDGVVVKGVEVSDLKKGPGWIDYTDLPGATGNCGISGHRTTYGAPFRRLDQLAEGDTIDLYSPYRRYRYAVDRVFRVLPSEVEVVDSTPQPTLTLTACDPPYSARYRLIVQAKLVEVRRVEQ